MTRLAIMSDLHIDINQFGEFENAALIQALKDNNINHLHIAGDISNHFETISLPFLKLLEKHVTVTYNLGNHDLLDLDENFIERHDFQEYHFGNKTLLALHGWYDYSLADYPDDINKHEKVKKQFWFDRRLKRPLSDIELTQAILSKLKEKLSHFEEAPIISLHFVPHKNFTLQYHRLKPFNAFLGSQHFHELFKKYGIKDVVFGHAHRQYKDVTIEGVNYHSRPLGYIWEYSLTWDYLQNEIESDWSLNLSPQKRYRQVKDTKAFQTFYQQNLVSEFKQAMTIFEI